MTTRRDFFRKAALPTLGFSLLGANAAPAAPGAAPLPARMAGAKPVHDLKTKRLEKVRVAVIGLSRGMALLDGAQRSDFSEVTVVCDLRKDRCANAVNAVKKKRGVEPAVICGGQDAWQDIAKRDDVDVVVIATPWELHVPMAVAMMKAGKHAFVEVSAAVTLKECWELVDTSERTQRHCVMMENCCYGESELLVLNMVREGVFGEITHGEAAYIHDLRGMLFALGTEGDWRREYHKKYDGNLYPTHGLGPVAQYMGINRGDRFKFIVSVSSPEIGLTKWRDDKKPNGGKHATEKYVTGDMNTSIIKTEMGRTIMVQHDIISPRPYSRINMLSGTGGTFVGYPDRMALDDPGKYGLKTGSHEWLPAGELATLREKFKHPLLKRLESSAKGGGHGGMDVVMMIRHLECIRNGEPPDSTVYDAAAWSSILQLSTQSVAAGSQPMEIPDFTRGVWKGLKPLPIVS
ncbi:Gfo/Idh/MocA family oxidoreductase [Luteolibacter ambystomatis]|uniref:Gfo/Idh/MocA family oxidoreductase n=1 Tax=Luteolibacter ambystomatis TaxID=2824561 RepID=A0A975GA03_9BACT|nr:Gfo/Idh/MocA family oxidoreductase [Luteolibacter ambystomatis]QUE51500.1 Gfo/Idh/MocA family oxidoreductase [Luteolibacter ambystomatis]